MNTNTIDASLCAKMFLAGAKNLDAKKEWINELNVFPVPDGDTGTNMTLTIMSAAREVSALDPLDMDNLSRAISSGSLRGARGNSGVILSQLLRGFTNVIRTEDEITTTVLVASLQKAVETAYKAVMKPKEGTILTVARGVADRAAELLEEDPDIGMGDLLEQTLIRAEEVLEQTPEMLPVLKEAGVVDSGGQGLIQVLKGAIDAFNGIEVEGAPDLDLGAVPAAGTGSKPIGAAMEADIRFGYCTEFIINLEKEYTDETEQEFKSYLSSIGDSLVVVSDDDIVKVHVHTNDPGLAIQRALTYGSLTHMKIDNMREEHNERVIHEADRQKAAEKEAKAEKAGAAEKSEEKLNDYGFISVTIGDGLADIFRDLGVDYLIEGGQTMNPSTEDMLTAIGEVKAKNIFILPNNKNIVLAANQAKDMCEDKNIIVIPTATVPQGITAIINFVPEKSPEENAAVMEEEISRVSTGQITYAIRDTHIDDKVIKAGDIMSLGDSDILSVGKDLDPVADETVDRLVSDDTELISIYYGEDMSKEEASAFAGRVEEKYPGCDVELNYGGQPIYYYIISAE